MPPMKSVSIPEVSQFFFVNLHLTVPNMKRAIAVRMIAIGNGLNVAFDMKMNTYVNSGMNPKIMNEMNVVSPLFVGE